MSLSFAPQTLEDLVSGLIHTSGAEGQDRVSRSGCRRHRFDAALHRAYIVRGLVPEGADPGSERLGRHAFNGMLRSGVYIHHMHRISLMKCPGKIVHQGLGARVTVRLKQHMNVLEAASASAPKGRSNLGRVVPVVIDHRDAALRATDLKAPVDAAESSQSLADSVRRNLELQTGGYRRSRVQYVVRARNVKAKASQIALTEFEMKFAG